MTNKKDKKSQVEDDCGCGNKSKLNDSKRDINKNKKIKKKSFFK